MIITLAFVVLLTFAVVAFFSRATYNRGNESSSAGRIKADIVARSAVDAIVADLISEMRVNSTGTNINGALVLTPTNNASMVPQRNDSSNLMGAGANYTLKVSGSSASFLNLVKQSIASQRMYSGAGAGIIGSPVNSGSAALDGRVVTAARWNKPVLTTVNAFTKTTETPDWVLLSRAGILQDSNPSVDTIKDSRAISTPNSQYVTGRFAFNIYDEGGLLDINVAGYNTATTGTGLLPIASTLGGKQLGTIPGITGPGAFVDWRTASALKAAAFASGKPTTSPYVNYVLGSATNGFLSLFHDASGANVDKKLLSRQDLINYLSTVQLGFTSGTTGSNALQYLTTFSRDTNAPTWKPPTVSGTNPNVFLVRVAKSFKRPDGSTAQVGDPLVTARFPLSRIAGLNYINNGVNASAISTRSTLNDGSMVVASNATVLRDFGLVWDASNNRYLYTSPSGGSTAPSIKTLAEVVLLGREPDFFELLKAGVLSGSLGKYTALNNVNDTTVQLPWPSALESNILADKNTDRQILQIGANIIDQYDADDVPTRIATNVTSNSNLAKLDVFGVENNFYIQHVFQTHFRDLLTPVASGSTTLTKYPNVVSYHQFQMWNPHGNAAKSPAIKYRITATQGQTYTGAVVGGKSNLKGPVENIASRYIEFTHVPTPDPFLLNTSTPTTASHSSGTYPSGTSKLVGMFLGRLSMQSYAYPPPPAIASGNYYNYVGYNAPVIYELSANFPNANWRTIEQFGLLQDTMYGGDAPSGTADGLYAAATALSTGGNADWVSGLVWANSDPRVLRGGFGGATGGPNLVNKTIRTGASPGTDFWQFNHATSGLSPCWTTSATHGTIPSYAFGEMAENLSGSKTTFKDLDGILRRGDETTTNNVYVTPATAATLSARPQVLNRPFQTVAELGYAMRGDPWKTLNFFSGDSADAALLDLFSILDQPTIVAGRVNLNTRQGPVLSALLMGAFKVSGSNALSQKEATDFSNLLVQTTGSSSLINRADLVTKYASSTAYSGDFSAPATTDLIKERRESPMRALADVGQTRTWNLMIDVIAQSGRYPQTATDLNQFAVDGETRFWVHLAIDRFTGQVIDRQIETVKE